MRISKERKQQIKLYLLRHIKARDPEYIQKTVSTFDISKPTVYSYLRQLADENAIVRKEENSKCPYELQYKTSSFVYSAKENLEEDRIFYNDIAPLLEAEGVAKNVFDIWSHIFMEMMNNAIEHANATQIECCVRRNMLETDILIVDNGVGIFNKIREYYEQVLKTRISLDEAVAALFPGKLTTDKERHSGEGIFFSSRLADEFVIFSEGKVFTHNSFKDVFLDIPEELSLAPMSGTAVYMNLNIESKRNIREVFDLFSDSDKGFFKTQLPLSHIFSNKYPVSRSEARRLGAMVSKFSEVTLDFKDIEQIGQGFAHELFVVFPKAHPEINISISNVSEDTDKMIKHVKNTKN